MTDKAPTHRGRPAIYKTEKERLEARRAYNREYHRNKRQPKIETDPAYREKINKQRRERYRRSTNFVPKNFGKFAGSAERFARLEDIGRAKRTRVVTIDDMATMIGIVPKVLSGWIENEKFPRPVHKTSDGQRVFTVPEANELSAQLKKSLKGRSTFRPTDTDLIAELHATMIRLNS